MVGILDTGTNVTTTTSLSPPDHGTDKFSTSAPAISHSAILLLNKTLIICK
jgi:hypothetical protein